MNTRVLKKQINILLTDRKVLPAHLLEETLYEGLQVQPTAVCMVLSYPLLSLFWGNYFSAFDTGACEHIHTCTYTHRGVMLGPLVTTKGLLMNQNNWPSGLSLEV